MNPDFTIDLDIFTKQFTAKIWADLIALRIIIASIKDKSYANFQTHTTNGFSLTAQLPNLNQGLIDYEVVKTFLSMMRNVNDFLDRMVTVKSFSEKQIQAPKQMTTQEAIMFLQTQLDQELFDYCQRTREEFPEKLKHFENLPPEFVRYLTTYNVLRNCYEHQKAISQRGIQIPIKKMRLTAKGKEVKIGEVIPGGSTIAISFKQKTINIKKGFPAILTYEDVESTALYLVLEIPPQITAHLIGIKTTF